MCLYCDVMSYFVWLNGVNMIDSANLHNFFIKPKHLNVFSLNIILRFHTIYKSNRICYSAKKSAKIIIIG